MFSLLCPSYLTTLSLYQSIVPRHTLDVCMKYSHVPQTEAPYKLDRAEQEIDWAEEPQKVSIVVTNYLPGVLQWLVHHNTTSIIFSKNDSTPRQHHPPVLTYPAQI